MSEKSKADKLKFGQKTNAVRLLDTKGIGYELHSYEAKDGFLDGISVANAIEIDVSRVFKTLVVRGASGLHSVCVIPVVMELDLKKAASHLGEKRIDLIPAKEITAVTGYIKGGCSPLGMKKVFRTVIDQSATDHSRIVVSAGKVGLQMELAPADLYALLPADWADLSTPM